MPSHILSMQFIFVFLLPLALYVPSAAGATTRTKTPSPNAANAPFHCTNARAWTTNTQVGLRAADCKEAMAEFDREAEKQNAQGVEWGTPYWANPRAFVRPLGHPTVWTPVRYASGTCVLSVVLMGQAGQIPDKPPPPYENKVLESWTAVYEHAQILWGECEHLRTSVGWIRMGGSSLGVFFYDVESKKDNEIRGMRPMFDSLGSINTSNVLLAGYHSYNFSSA